LTLFHRSGDRGAPSRLVVTQRQGRNETLNHHSPEDGKLHVAALVAVPDPPSLIDLRRRVEKMLPKIDLPELVLERSCPGIPVSSRHSPTSPETTPA
jgi:hypothetical protein